MTRILPAARAVAALAWMALAQASLAQGTPPAFASGLDEPRGITQLADGRVLVTEFLVGRVAAFGADGTPLGTFASGLDDPYAITQLADGRVLVAEFNAGTVRALGPDGQSLGLFATGLDGPVDIAQLADGTVLVAETYTPGAQAFSPTGTPLGTHVTSTTGDGSAYGTTQLADGRILLTVSGPFEVLQAFTASGAFVEAFDTRTDNVFSTVGQLIQLADSRILVLDFSLGEVESFSTAGVYLGRFATIPDLLTDLVQLADGRILVSNNTDRVYVVDAATASEPVAGAVTTLSVSPNPLRVATTVGLTLETLQKVVVAVDDLLGRRVAVLHAGPLGAGEHALRLDASALPPGVYVVRVAGETAVQTQRMTVIR